MENKNNVSGVLFVFIGMVMFSSKAILVKLGYRVEGVDFVSMLFLRMLFAFPFYLIIASIYAYKKKVKLTNKNRWSLLVLGVMGYYCASLFDFWGLSYITAGLERLIVFIYPTLVVLISAVFLKHKIRLKEYIALAVTYGGIAIVMLGSPQMEQDNAFLGSFLVFLSALTFAIYLVGSGTMIKQLGSTYYNSLAMLVSTVAVFLHYIIAKEHPIENLQKLPSEAYSIGFLMAVIATVIPSFLIMEGIKRIGSSKASIIGSVGPVSTIIMEYLILGESMDWVQQIGTVVVLIGVLVVSLEKNKTALKPKI